MESSRLSSAERSGRTLERRHTEHQRTTFFSTGEGREESLGIYGEKTGEREV